MKKRLTILLMLSCMFWLGQTQAQTFEKSNIVIDAGIGLGATYSIAGGGLGLPFGAGLEYAITDDIGVGGTFGFASNDGFSTLWIGVDGAYHFNNLFNSPPEDIDLYAGVALMYRTYNFKTGSSLLDNLVYPGVFAGARYYFSDNFAAQGEVGNGYGWLRLGVALRL